MEWPKVYVLQNTDTIRNISQSGGAFAVISDYVLERNGVIFGCVLNEHLEAVHTRAENIESLHRMHGSKYVQNRIGDLLSEVERNLKKGRLVLFSGTSCQVMGLRKYLTEKVSREDWFV